MLPADNLALGLPADAAVGPAAMNVIGGVVVLRFDADFEGRTLALIPWKSLVSRGLLWTCGQAPPAADSMRIVDADSLQLTTLTMLPNSCLDPAGE